MINTIPSSAIVGKDCGVPVGHYLAKCKGWNFRAEMYCDGINWFYADHCIGDPDTPRLCPIKDGVELIYIEMNDWQPFRFPPLKEEKEVPLNQIDWWSKDVIDEINRKNDLKRKYGVGLPTLAEFEKLMKRNQDESK